MVSYLLLLKALVLKTSSRPFKRINLKLKKPRLKPQRSVPNSLDLLKDSSLDKMRKMQRPTRTLLSTKRNLLRRSLSTKQSHPERNLAKMKKIRLTIVSATIMEIVSIVNADLLLLTKKRVRMMMMDSNRLLRKIRKEVEKVEEDMEFAEEAVSTKVEMITNTGTVSLELTMKMKSLSLSQQTLPLHRLRQLPFLFQHQSSQVGVDFNSEQTSKKFDLKKQ